MDDKILKYVKYAFAIVCIFVIGSIAISSIEKNVNQKDYIGLYKDVLLFETIDKDYNNVAYEMADSLTYEVDDKLFFVSDFPINGEGGYGQRYFDEEEKYQSDNDIIKIIPKAYFFSYSEKGKFVSGKGYSYYIRTCKDLEEDKFGYNSDNYFKTVVILFKNVDVNLPSDNTSLYKQNFKSIGMYEFHSYDRVDERLSNDVSKEAADFINENGVVTFYDIINDKENIEYNISSVSVEIESENNSCKLVDGVKKVDKISTNDFLGLIINVSCEDSVDSFVLDFQYVIDIKDGLWMDITFMSEVHRNETINGKVQVVLNK